MSNATNTTVKNFGKNMLFCFFCLIASKTHTSARSRSQSVSTHKKQFAPNKERKVYHYEHGVKVEGPIPTHQDVQMCGPSTLPPRNWQLGYQSLNVKSATVEQNQKYLASYVGDAVASSMMKKAQFTSQFKVQYNIFKADQETNPRSPYKRLFGCFTFLIKITNKGRTLLAIPFYAGYTVYTGRYSNLDGRLMTRDKNFIPIPGAKLNDMYLNISKSISSRKRGYNNLFK